MTGYIGYKGDAPGHMPPDYRPMDQRIPNYPPNIPPMPPPNIHPPLPIEANQPPRVRLYLCEHLRRQAPHIFAQGPLSQHQKPNIPKTKPTKQVEPQQTNQVIWKGYISRNGTKVVPVIATSNNNDATSYIKDIEFINMTHRLTLENNFDREPLAIFTLRPTLTNHKEEFDEHLHYYPKGKIGVCPIDSDHVIFFCTQGNALFDKYSETKSVDTATCLIIKLVPKEESTGDKAVTSSSSGGNWLSQLSSMAKLLGS